MGVVRIGIKISYYRMDNSKINPYIYGQLIFDKGAMTTEWENLSLFNR